MGGVQSFWRVWVEDPVEANCPGSQVEQWNEGMMVNRKLSFFFPQFWQFRVFSFLWSLLLSRCHYSWRGREGRVSINGNQWPFQFFILQCWMTIMHFWHCLVQLDWECKCLLQPCLEPLTHGDSLSVMYFPSTSWAPTVLLLFSR